MTYLRLAASCLLWFLAVAVGVPAQFAMHISETLGDLADELWEKS